MRARHAAALAPAAVLFGLWGWAGAPGSPAAGLALAGVCAVACPAAMLSSPGFPACLVPRHARAAHRKRAGRRCEAPGWMHRLALASGLARCSARRLGGCEGPPEVDHVCPSAAGGLAWFWNLAVLCAHHNRVKSDYWVHRDGWVEYRPWPGFDDRAMAARILACERRHRLSPGRYLLAVLALR